MAIQFVNVKQSDVSVGEQDSVQQHQLNAVQDKAQVLNILENLGKARVIKLVTFALPLQLGACGPASQAPAGPGHGRILKCCHRHTHHCICFSCVAEDLTHVHSTLRTV
jgi:hypothetical protein